MKYEVDEIKDFLVIHVMGDLTLKDHIEILEKAINEHIEQGFHKFLFNLEKLINIDVDGIGIFMDCLTDVAVHDGECYLFVEDDVVYEKITRTGLEKLIEVYRDKNEFAEEHNLEVPKGML